ncbi:unnamed protein product [Caenorhabditis sp. 36 PRJEB53466]|nr:unnamed protein product [Caenorhabditis sp. 36 PRJEB53466]
MCFWIFLFLMSSCSSFLWTLFGNSGCNFCRCITNCSNQKLSSTYNAPQNSYQYITPSAFQSVSQYQTYSNPSTENYISHVPIITSTSAYRGPPAASPTSREQLQHDDHVYSTNQVAYLSELRPVSAVEYGNRALSQLEDELAAEKYKFNAQKEIERNEKQRQNRIRVFKIKPHKSRVNFGMVEWQSSQVAKYTNEKTVDKFIEATESNNVNTEEDFKEFIPIEIGSEPELADEEPARPPPNVRNRISHDPILVHRRRFVS